MQVVWSRRAVLHLSSIRRYINQFHPDAAQRTGKRVLNAVATLSRHPQIGRAGRLILTREFAIPGTPYIIVYTVQDATLEICAIFHGAQIIR